MDAERTCKRCKGAGQVEDILHNAYPDKYPEHKACSRCDGTGKFLAPDFGAILSVLLVTRKGQKTFRASKPKGSCRDMSYNRVYYVWRLARFHGGADVCLPMCAMMDIEGDPYEPELDGLASLIAAKVFGSSHAGSARWGAALGCGEAPEGLPASAYPGGPVTDANKPGSERPELS